MLQPIYAYDIMEDGSARPVDDIGAPPPSELAYRWIHLDLNSEDVRGWIEHKAGDVVALALTRQDTRPGLNLMDEGAIVILRGVNLNPGSDPEDMVSIRLWVQDRLLISTRMRKLMAVTTIREQIDAGHPPRSPGEFIAALSTGLAERMDPVIAELTDQIDELEEKSVDTAAGLRTALADIRRATIALRRYLAPQRDALARLSTDTSGLLARPVQIRLRETADQVTRLVEELDSVRERCGILNDQLVDRRAEEMNSNMLILSIVAAVFLPLGFLTGLLGINVGGMPGADYQWAFYIVCAICITIAAGLVWWFNRSRWL